MTMAGHSEGCEELDSGSGSEPEGDSGIKGFAAHNSLQVSQLLTQLEAEKPSLWNCPALC